MKERKTTRTAHGHCRLLLLVCAGALSVTECTAEDGSDGATTGLSDALELWQLDSVPLISIGDTEADPLYDVVGIAITAEHVVIAQEGTGTFRFYDRSGTLDHVVGGRGEGPGEFGDLDWMRRSGDHLFAYDWHGREISRYNLDGQWLGSAALSPPEDFPFVRAEGVFPDGSLLVLAPDVNFRPTEPTVARNPQTLLLHEEDGGYAGRLFETMGSETWYEPFGVAGTQQMSRLFGRISGVAVIDSLFVVLENDSYDIPVYGPDGLVRDTLRPAVVPDPTPLTRAEADLSRQFLLDSWDLGPAQAEVEDMLTAMGFPEHLPPYGRLSLGYPNHPPMTVADGLIWALRYGGLPREGAGPDGPEWYVFRPGTGQIATLSSPDDVVLYDVLGDLAAVLRRTELDEEIVELRRILGR